MVLYFKTTVHQFFENIWYFFLVYFLLSNLSLWSVDIFCWPFFFHFCRRRIKVVDVNDNRPEFTLRAQGTGGYSFSTKETVRVGETLYTSVAVKVKKILSVIFMNLKFKIWMFLWVNIYRIGVYSRAAPWS